MTAPNSTAPTPTPAPITEPQKLFDILGIVAYLRSIGAGAATTNFAREIIASGQVPHVRIGKKFYVSKASLDRWLETREKRPR